LCESLYGQLRRSGDEAAQVAARAKQREYEKKRKEARDADKALRARRLPREDRKKARDAEVLPLLAEAESARTVWLGLLEKAVPAQYLALGKTPVVPEQEYRQFSQRAADMAAPDAREDADFVTALGSEACLRPDGKIIPTEFCLILGSGQQFFLETVQHLMTEITQAKIRRCLFGPWTYEDPKRSFRWDPVEDNRYAFRWSDPSGEEVRTEHGANLLAAMGLPLLPTVPLGRTLGTTGFVHDEKVPMFTWSLWECPIVLDVLRSLLALDNLRQERPDREALRRMGVAEVYRCAKIEVGKPPLSKLNLSVAAPV
jgi:hypothetical protein